MCDKTSKDIVLDLLKGNDKLDVIDYQILVELYEYSKEDEKNQKLYKFCEFEFKLYIYDQNFSD